MPFWNRNISIFDDWSLVHLSVGFIIGISKIMGTIAFLILHSLMEIWENSDVGIATWQGWGSDKYQGDSKRNILGDTISAMLGYYIGTMVKQ